MGANMYSPRLVGVAGLGVAIAYMNIERIAFAWIQKKINSRKADPTKYRRARKQRTAAYRLVPTTPTDPNISAK